MHSSLATDFDSDDLAGSKLGFIDFSIWNQLQKAPKLSKCDKNFVSKYFEFIRNEKKLVKCAKKNVSELCEYSKSIANTPVIGLSNTNGRRMYSHFVSTGDNSQHDFPLQNLRSTSIMFATAMKQTKKNV